jgi:hypothetical protein
MDVMAQTKRSVEDTTHFDANVKRFKEMARTPKEKKKNRRRRFDLQDFPISKDYGPYLGEGCGIAKSRHHHQIIGGNGAVSSKGIEKKVVNT